MLIIILNQNVKCLNIKKRDKKMNEKYIDGTKKDWTGLIISFLILFCIAQLPIVAYFLSDSKIVGSEIVECYDKYGNEIVGSSCIDYEYETHPIVYLSIFLMMLVLPLMFYYITYSMNKGGLYNDE